MSLSLVSATSDSHNDINMWDTLRKLKIHFFFDNVKPLRPRTSPLWRCFLFYTSPYIGCCKFNLLSVLHKTFFLRSGVESVKVFFCKCQTPDEGCLEFISERVYFVPPWFAYGWLSKQDPVISLGLQLCFWHFLLHHMHLNNSGGIHIYLDLLHLVSTKSLWASDLVSLAHASQICCIHMCFLICDDWSDSNSF